MLICHSLKQSSSVAIRLYATANRCMRNHETKFSTCHPTMAPLLRAPARPLQSLPSSLRFLLRLSTHPKSPIPSQYSNRSSHCPALRPDLHTASLFRKRQQHTLSTDTDSDKVPLHAIKVKQNLHSGEGPS